MVKPMARNFISPKDSLKYHGTSRRRVQTYKEDVVVFRLSPQVLEDALLPEALHVVPVVDHSVLDGVVKGVSSVRTSRRGRQLVRLSRLRYRKRPKRS